MAMTMAMAGAVAMTVSVVSFDFGNCNVYEHGYDHGDGCDYGSGNGCDYYYWLAHASVKRQCRPTSLPPCDAARAGNCSAGCRPVSTDRPGNAVHMTTTQGDAATGGEMT